jgi:hypothetical protein
MMKLLAASENRAIKTAFSEYSEMGGNLKEVMLCYEIKMQV